MSRKKYLLLYALLIAAALLTFGRADVAVPLSRPLSEFPSRVGGWVLAGEERMGEDVLNVLKPTDYLSRTYTDDSGNRVHLYLGYHGGGKGVGEVHSPRNCLPGAGWQQLGGEAEGFTSDGRGVNAMAVTYGKEGARQFFFYWFQIGPVSTASEYRMKFEQLSRKLFHNRKDVLFVRISLPETGNAEAARGAARRFAKDFEPVIRTLIAPDRD